MKPLKVPPPTLQMKSGMTTREMDFCDMHILLNKTPDEIFVATHGSAYSKSECMRKSRDLMAEPRIKRYIEERQIQLNKWYFSGNGNIEGSDSTPSKPKTIDEVINSNSQRVLEEVDMILQNRNDPNFSDVLKLYLQKQLKDIEMDRTAEPPRRYLPERCDSCNYKNWIETNCEPLCSKCKYKKFGEENGLHLTYQNQIEDVSL